jgi:Domain of unknown function (DUF4136)
MKKFYFPLLSVLFASCLGFREVPVEYDYSYKGNFKRYRTYEIMNPIGLLDSSMSNELIERSIIARMKFLGFKRTEHRPHLIIGYKMFKDSLKFNGYAQPDIEQWVKSENENLDYERTKYTMKTGTLLIQFYDRRQNRAIWQGYATALYGDIDFGNQRQLKNAVFSILDKYRFWAEGFVEGTEEAHSDKEL